MSNYQLYNILKCVNVITLRYNFQLDALPNETLGYIRTQIEYIKYIISTI